MFLLSRHMCQIETWPAGEPVLPPAGSFRACTNRAVPV
ncbi:hypothetical protein DCCM_0526 [Desulfocucumis palustris]|uniref:Uncharacterized protein n=1 Tax=Desulfocucumis palustris TaxID=1898651 RepID=A0A2L2X8L4_9FIRM|nr:hypothetical protein DCCM_0526 [Desulfocucumis palustris]